jgi:microsomal dipeptidase-like Zn-dependent dipeptidase
MRKLGFFVVAAVVLILALAHWWLPGRIESGMNEQLPQEPYQVSEAGRQLHDSLFVADLHSDSLLWKRDLSQRSNRGHMDVPRLQEGNVALQVFSATTKSPKGQNYDENEADSDQITPLVVAQFWPPRTWSSLYERAVYQLEKLESLAESDEVMLVKSQQDLRALIEARTAGNNVVGGVYLIEGAHPLEGEIDNLDRLFDQGLRIVGLTHFFDNELGGSLHGTSGDGLTEFGRAVVQRADELGLIIDIAHASAEMVREVLALTRRPTILSHGGLKGNCDTARNLDDDLMIEFAERGGLLGVGFWDAAICDPTPAGVVAAIRYGIDLLGIDHVALGSDYDGATAVPFDASDLSVLTDEMMRQGFSDSEIRAVMGENVKRFLLENLPGKG